MLSFMQTVHHHRSCRVMKLEYFDQTSIESLFIDCADSSLRQSLRRESYELALMRSRIGYLPLNLALVIFVVPLSTLAQGRFDVTPLFGYSSSANFPLASDTNSKNRARVDSSGSFGIGVGVRYDDEQVIEFHYSRQSSTMRFEGLPAAEPRFPKSFGSTAISRRLHARIRA